MNKPAINLQDGFLNQVRKDAVIVTIYLVNGFQVRGIVRGFDNFTIILEN
ncbi:MAG TPA: RNA chaperone Hfq, partial [Firmicutes bacterium]|nr:RNA chaperone Hfq [Bacillota bacterium]HCF92008.1 RNA chaperone Hfq [Bacillota bacterium]